MPARQAVISLPDDHTALLERFEAVERLSELFVIHAYVFCEEAKDFLGILGKPAEITVAAEEGASRSFSGLIFEVETVDETPTGIRYRLTIRPWLYALTRNMEICIFQEKSTKDILQDVFNKRGRNDVDFSNLTKNYPKREYCVQYHESDFNFISRLMEEEGIYYYFDHKGGEHKLVLCDDRESHKDSESTSLRYLPHEDAVADDRVWRWTESVVSGAEGKATYRNFDFTRPRFSLEGSHEIAPGQSESSDSTPYYLRLRPQDAPSSSTMPAQPVELYDFPYDFLDTGRGQTIAETTMLSTRRHERHYRGEGDALLLACGKLLKLSDHPIARLDQSYLVTGLTYKIEAEQYVSGTSSGTPEAGKEPVIVEIIAAPADQPWRAPQVTEKPLALGPETAIVTGQQGDTIYTDKYGRVKVRFHWDRAQASADNTCWIRVASASGDAGFGHVALPRVGQEVVVSFLNGDPDQPLVIGTVFNGDKTQPYTLPDDKTRSVWRSHTIDGGAADYNEISFEDKTGGEIFNVQAQKDRTTLIKNDDTKTIKKNLTTTVQEGNEVREVTTGTRTTTIKGNETLTVQSGDMKTDVSSGDYTLSVDSGQITITAAKKITLTVGQSSITMDPTTITVQSLTINVLANAELNTNGKATANHTSDAMLAVSAPMVTINS
ncbi:MAG TPA: type VI secretion system tip protein TssI/VgrG [Caulobacteraceae bacterium]